MIEECRRVQNGVSSPRAATGCTSNNSSEWPNRAAVYPNKIHVKGSFAPRKGVRMSPELTTPLPARKLLLKHVCTSERYCSGLDCANKILENRGDWQNRALHAVQPRKTLLPAAEKQSHCANNVSGNKVDSNIADKVNCASKSTAVASQIGASNRTFKLQPLNRLSCPTMEANGSRNNNWRYIQQSRPPYQNRHTIEFTDENSWIPNSQNYNRPNTVDARGDSDAFTDVNIHLIVNDNETRELGDDEGMNAEMSYRINGQTSRIYDSIQHLYHNEAKEDDLSKGDNFETPTSPTSAEPLTISLNTSNSITAFSQTATGAAGGSDSGVSSGMSPPPVPVKVSSRCQTSETATSSGDRNRVLMGHKNPENAIKKYHPLFALCGDTTAEDISCPPCKEDEKEEALLSHWNNGGLLKAVAPVVPVSLPQSSPHPPSSPPYNPHPSTQSACPDNSAAVQASYCCGHDGRNSTITPTTTAAVCNLVANGKLMTDGFTPSTGDEINVVDQDQPPPKHIGSPIAQFRHYAFTNEYCGRDIDASSEQCSSLVTGCAPSDTGIESSQLPSSLEISVDEESASDCIEDPLFVSCGPLSTAIATRPTYQNQATQTPNPVSFHTYRHSQQPNASSVSQVPLNYNSIPTYDFVDGPAGVGDVLTVQQTTGLVYEITTTVETKLPCPTRATEKLAPEKRRSNVSASNQTAVRIRRKPKRNKTMSHRVPSEEFCPLATSDDYRISLDTLPIGHQSSKYFRKPQTPFLPQGFGSADKLLDQTQGEASFIPMSSRLRTSSYEHALNSSRNNLYLPSDQGTYFGSAFYSAQPAQVQYQRLPQGRASDNRKTYSLRPSYLDDESQFDFTMERHRTRSFDYLSDFDQRCPGTNPGIVPSGAPLTSLKHNSNRFSQLSNRNDRAGCVSAESLRVSPVTERHNLLSDFLRTISNLCSKSRNRRSAAFESRHQNTCGMTFPLNPLTPPSTAVLSSQRSNEEAQVDPVTKYLRAARNGRQEEMVALLQQYGHHGVHVEVCNSSGLNALHLAAKEGHLHIAQLLIEAGIDIQAMTKKGNTALHIAALSGHLALVQLLVRRGANVNSITPERHFTPLYMAAQESHLNVVKYLVSEGADVNLLTDDGFSPLAVAVQQKHANIVSFLLRLDSSAHGTGTLPGDTMRSDTSRRQRSTSAARKSHLPDLHIAVKKDDSKATALLLQQPSADPNIRAQGSGFTALHLAAHYGYVSIAQILLTHGANLNVPAAKDNITALHVAAKCGQTEMCRLLLGHGAEPNAKTKDGLTPLHLASRNGHEEVVDCLLLHGGGGFVEFRSKTKSGLTALHLSAQANVPEGHDCTQGHIACARLLLFHGIHVDEISRDLLTPLHIAAHCGHLAMAKYLLQHYANPDARALNGFAPLHVAVRKRRIPVIILLLEYYADVNITTESGLTPLHVAAFVGAEEAMKLLLKNEAVVNCESALGERPLHLAVRANNLKLAELLLNCGSEVDARTGDGGQTSLHLAARANSAPMCELLLKHGANPTNFASSAGGHSVLHAAARDGAFDCAQMLLRCGVDPNCRTTKGGELTPLHLAAKHGHLELCRLLLANGASPDLAATGNSCFTPLHMALMNGHDSVASLLLKSGSSANSIAANGVSALHMAARRNDVDMCKQLIDQGAYPDAQTKWGESAAHTAARLGYLDLLKFLYQYCDANLYITSPLGVTPLHLAAQEDKTTVCRFLVEGCRPFRGSGINNPLEMRTRSGYTALHIAVYHNCVSTVLYLLQCGRCNPNWQTHLSGYSPLHVAAQQGNTSLVQLLLRANCQPDLKTNSGSTALAIASKLRYVTLVEVLKSKTTTAVTLTPEMENEIRSFRAPESLQDATQWGDNMVGGGQTNIAEQEDGEEIDYPETEDMNCFLAPADLQFLTKETDALPHLGASTSTRSLPRSGAQTPTHFESYASFNKYLSPNSNAGSRPASGTSNISGYTTTSYGDNLLLSPVNAGSLMARLSISDLAHVRTFEQQVPSDNVESLPNKLSAAGFLISFVADAKGCRMRAARGNRLCFIIPARSCEQPQRITCRHIRRHKLIAPPPLAEDQALAARVLELGPVGSKFTGGPIIVEVPYVASLSNGEREIAVFTFSPKQSGGEWAEHKQPDIEPRIKMLLDSHLEDCKSPSSRRSSSTNEESLRADDSVPDQRLVRVILTEIPQYIALVSRLKKDKVEITPMGGILSSSVEARVQLSFPEKAVKKDVKLSLHVLRVRSDIITRLLTNPQGLITASNLFYCSPVVTIEPRKRQFHERFTICLPSPIPASNENPGANVAARRPSYAGQASGIRLLRSVSDSIHPAVWEDITDQTRLGELQNGCVTFSSKVSARFWLVHSPRPRSTPELLKIAHAVYNEAIKIPYMAKFIVFAKRHAENEARLRLFCVTDDKHEGLMSSSTLESQENFTQIAKSRDVEIFDGNRNFLDWDANSNLFPVQHPLNSFRSTSLMSPKTDSRDNDSSYGNGQDQQLSLTFWAFKENRIHFFVQVKDTLLVQSGGPTGRLQIYSSGRSHLKSLRSENELLQQHICTLNLVLPNVQTASLENGSEPGKSMNHIVNFASSGERRRDPTGRLCEPNLSPDSSAERALLRLSVVAENVGVDWQRLGLELGIDPNNINIIDLQVGSGSSPGSTATGPNSAHAHKAYRMLHHWAEYQGVNATGAALEKALNAIGRGEINPMWKRPVFRDPGNNERVSSRVLGSAEAVANRDALVLEDISIEGGTGGDHVVRKLTRIIRVDPDGSRQEYLHEANPNGDSGENTEKLIEKAIADSPFRATSGQHSETFETSVRQRVIDKEVVKKTTLVDGSEHVVVETAGINPRRDGGVAAMAEEQGEKNAYFSNGGASSSFDAHSSSSRQSTVGEDVVDAADDPYSAEEEAELQNILDSYLQQHHEPPQ